jgi:hypothetical protein
MRPNASPLAVAGWSLAVVLCLSAPLAAQEAGGDAAALAKSLSNPIASLISVPFQLNHDEGYGTGDGTKTFLNVQPVIPLTLTPEWNLIIRTIVPLVTQDDVVPGTGSQSGLGDITQSFFFSPQAPGPGGLIWGVGPVVLWPTATESELGAEKWGLGPTGVALVQRGPWTMGALANHIWSVAGDDDRADINATFLQPFISHTSSRGTSITLNTESTYNWDAEEWSVPINLQVAQVLKIGDQPVQIGGGVRYWAESADGGPDGWGFRLSFTLLYPR